MKEILPDQSEQQLKPIRSKSALKELEISAMLDEFRENWLVEIEQKQSESQHEKLTMGEDAAANDCVMDNLR